MEKKERIAVYIRISKMEGGGVCSQSVCNQRELLDKTIEMDQGLSQMKKEYYIDENYSGTTIDRPALKKMLAGIFLGKIQAVMVKDFSRFSRNYLWISYFLETIVPRKALIFVSIGDGYDSRKKWEIGMSEAVRNLFYEYYCQDISHKVKGALYAKKKNGEFANGKVAYGYRRTSSGKWMVEKREAENVKEVYRMTAEGKSIREIAEKKGLSYARVWKILDNPVYQGNYYWQKTKEVYQGGFVCRKQPREEWEESKGCVPVFLSQTLYDQAQRKRKHTSSYGKSYRKRHMFAGIVKCGICGRGLCRNRGQGDKIVCKHCTEINVEIQKLEKVVVNVLKNKTRVCNRLFLKIFIKNIIVYSEPKIIVVFYAKMTYKCQSFINENDCIKDNIMIKLK